MFVWLIGTVCPIFLVNSVFNYFPCDRVLCSVSVHVISSWTPRQTRRWVKGAVWEVGTREPLKGFPWAPLYLLHAVGLCADPGSEHAEAGPGHLTLPICRIKDLMSKKAIFFVSLSIILLKHVCSVTNPSAYLLIRAYWTTKSHQVKPLYFVILKIWLQKIRSGPWRNQLLKSAEIDRDFRKLWIGPMHIMASLLISYTHPPSVIVRLLLSCVLFHHLRKLLTTEVVVMGTALCQRKEYTWQREHPIVKNLFSYQQVIQALGRRGGAFTCSPADNTDLGFSSYCLRTRSSGRRNWIWGHTRATAGITYYFLD